MNQSLKAQYQRPEGKLIERAMKTPPKVSGRALAEKVSLSEARIRQIVNGYRSEANVVLEIIGPTDTVARIAEELDISADEMEAAGRNDVAEELRNKPRVGYTEEGDLWMSDNSEERALLQTWLDAGEYAGPPPIEALALWGVEALLEGAARKHRDEMRLLNIVIQMARKKKGGDGNVDDATGDSAPNQAPEPGPAEQPGEAVGYDRLGAHAQERMRRESGQDDVIDRDLKR